MTKKIIVSLAILPIAVQLHAQTNTYKEMIEKRAAKIVAPLKIVDSVKFYKVQHLVADQYIHLNDVYVWRDSSYSKIKRENADNKSVMTQKKADVDSLVKMKVGVLHKNYLGDLSHELTNTQIEQIKNGMTYGVAPLTLKAYEDMIPTLTSEQKDQLWKWLLEARENAMDAESSEKKHAWFGKYKGRINNYLSTAGYDIQKERQQWEERIKAAKSK